MAYDHREILVESNNSYTQMSYFKIININYKYVYIKNPSFFNYQTLTLTLTLFRLKHPF